MNILKRSKISLYIQKVSIIQVVLWSKVGYYWKHRTFTHGQHSWTGSFLFNTWNRKIKKSSKDSVQQTFDLNIPKHEGFSGDFQLWRKRNHRFQRGKMKIYSIPEQTLQALNLATGFCFCFCFPAELCMCFIYKFYWERKLGIIENTEHLFMGNTHELESLCSLFEANRERKESSEESVQQTFDLNILKHEGLSVVSS